MINFKEIGVLTGSDQSQEWLLHWFYSNFRKHNPNCPIAFADFGMSPAAQNWCQERGVLIKAPELHHDPGEQPGFVFQQDRWEESNVNTSPSSNRNYVCFRKPLAIGQSPFARTLWLDLDCQVLGDLTPLLHTPLSFSKLGAVPSTFLCIKNLSKDKTFYFNKFTSGTILTEKDSPLLEQWIQSMDGKAAFETDEGPLSFLGEKIPMEITAIPHEYNWPVLVRGKNDQAIIYHWLGKPAKQLLKIILG